MSRSSTRQIVGITLVLVLALVAVWLLMPTADTGPAPVVEAPVPEPLEIAGSADGVPVLPDGPPGEAEVVMIDDEEANIPRTETCLMIAGWAQRKVPHYTILDNIRDQSMLFTEDDLACLTAARDVPPIVLRFAEMYQRRDQE